MSKTAWQMDNTLWKAFRTNHLKARLFLLEQCLNIIRFQREINQGSTNLVRQFFIWNLPRICVLVAERIWKGDIMVADIEDMGKLQKSILEDSQCKRSVDATKGWTFDIPSRRWNTKIVRKRLRIPKTHSKAGSNLKERRFQWRTTRWTGRVSTDKNNRWRWSPCRLLVDSRWLHLSSSQWTSSSTLQDHAHKSVLHEKRISDDWNVDVDRILSDSWTGFTKFTLLNENPPKGKTWSEVRLTRMQDRPDYLWLEIWSGMSQAAQKKEKREWAIEKPKLNDALRGIYFIDPDDKEFKNHYKRKEKLENPMEAAMPCKLKTTKSWYRHRWTDSESNNIPNSKYACIVKARECARKRLERTPSKDHEDHTAEKGFNSLSHTDPARKFVPMHQAMKIPDAKAAVDKEWEKLEKSPSWQMTEVKNKKKEVTWKHKERKKDDRFATVIDICHLKKCGVRTKVPKVQSSSRVPRRHMQSSLNRARLRLKWLWWTSSRCSICLHSSEFGGVAQIPKSACPCIWIRFSATHMAKILVKQQRSSGSSWAKSVRTPICRLLGRKDSSKKFHWDLDGKKYRIGNVCLFIENKDYACRYTWRLEESRIWLPCGRNWWSWLMLESQHHSLTTCFFGMYSTWLQIERAHYLKNTEGATTASWQTKRQKQKSWISYPDCQGAQDKQLMQFLLIPRYNWKMLPNFWKFQIGMSRHLDPSTTTQMA